jgi:methyl-accepting chemotaxis protein
MSKMKLKTKLQLAFLSISVLGTIVASIGINNMGKISEKADTMYSKELMGVANIREANVNLIYLGRARGNLILSTTQEERNTNLENMKKYQEEIDEHLGLSRSLYSSEKAKELFSEYDRISADYTNELNHVVSLVQKEELRQMNPELHAATQKARSIANRMDEILEGLARIKEQSAKDSALESADLYQSSKVLMISLVLLSLLTGGGIGFLVSRNINKQLGGEPDYAVDIVNKIASGDLTEKININESDTSSLLFSMKQMQKSLSDIVSQVRFGTDTIATASNQIASGNLDLSSRTEEQASSLEETASSMEELTSTVKQNADNAKQAKGLSDLAAKKAYRGGEEMTNIIKTMSDIEASSKQMENIISTIEGIAFQTNILALNAAVEAARAGEQGRGFAVVATEVRNLAQRSASAAKEIKDLINNSVEKISVGTNQAQVAGETITEVVGSVQKVADIVSEITAASQEQSIGIEQVNQAIMQMDDVTQQNAALVEEAAAASQSMQDQAVNLSELVSVFKTEHVAPKPVKSAKVVKPVMSKKSEFVVSKPTVISKAKPASDEWEEF